VAKQWTKRDHALFGYRPRPCTDGCVSNSSKYTSANSVRCELTVTRALLAVNPETNLFKNRRIDGNSTEIFWSNLDAKWLDLKHFKHKDFASFLKILRLTI